MHIRKGFVGQCPRTWSAVTDLGQEVPVGQMHTLPGIVCSRGGRGPGDHAGITQVIAANLRDVDDRLATG